MTEESKQAAAAVPQVVQSPALAPSRSGVLPALSADIADADVPALLADIERRVEALPGAFDAALARQQVVAVNAVAVAMQARNLRRVTDRALALIEARLAALMPANPPGRPPRPVGEPDGQLAGTDAGAPDRAPSAVRPAETSGGSSPPVGKPDGQLAGSDAGEPDRAPSAARPAETSGGSSPPAGKPDGQLAGFDAGEPEDRVPSAARPADAPGGSSPPAGKPDGQLAGFDAGEPDRVPLPSARTMRDIRAAHPDPADKQALRERMDRLQNRGVRVSRRALIAEVRREQTAAAEPPGVDGLPEPVADTRPLPVVYHAALDEHPLDAGSVDAVAMYASDAKDELDPCCPFAETVLRPGGVLLLRCEVGAEEEINERVTEEYDNGTPASLAYVETLAMVHGGHWWPVLVFVRQGDEAHLAERTAYVGDDEQACWCAIVADWTYPADGLVCDLCADDGRILAAADAAQRRAVGLCRDEEQVERVRAEVVRARGTPQE